MRIGRLVLLAFAMLQVGALQADEVLSRAEKAMASKKVRGDEALFLGQGRVVQGKPPLFLRPREDYFNQRTVFPYTLEYALWAMRSDRIALTQPMFRLNMGTQGVELERAIALSAAGASYPPLYMQQARQIMGIMKLALECRPGFSEPDFGPVGYEYVSSHQAAAMLLAYRRGCLSEASFKRKAAIYLQRVHGEFSLTRRRALSDLQVERMAVLCLLGHCAVIPPDVVSRLRAAQGKDGFWRFDENIKELAQLPEHATALSYFVLAAQAARH